MWKQMLKKLSVMLVTLALDWLFSKFETKEEAYNYVVDKINDLYKKK